MMSDFFQQIDFEKLERKRMSKELNVWLEMAREGASDAVLFWVGILPEEITIEEADEFITKNAEICYLLLKAYQKSIVKRGMNNEF